MLKKSLRGQPARFQLLSSPLPCFKMAGISLHLSFPSHLPSSNYILFSFINIPHNKSFDGQKLVNIPQALFGNKIYRLICLIICSYYLIIKLFFFFFANVLLTLIK